MRQRIANAPISFGGFGDVLLEVPSGELLARVADLGYQGCELGPPGSFGPAECLPESFGRVTLAAAGAYVPLHLTGDETAFDADIEPLKQTLLELQICQKANPADAPPPLAILADEGNEALIAQPFRGPEPALDSTAWATAVQRLNRALSMVRGAKVEVTFHPHFGTFVEKAAEIDRLTSPGESSI